MSDYRLLDAHEKLEYERQAGVYGDFSGSSSSDVERQKQYYERLARANAGVNTDWKRMALRTGFNHIHNLMLSGGSQDFRYNVSGSCNSTTGVMEKSDKEVASLRINLTYGDMNRLFFQNIASLSRNASDDVPYGSFSDYVRLNPYDSPYNADGSLNNDLAFYAANPLYEKNLSSYIRSRSGSFLDTFRTAGRSSPRARRSLLLLHADQKRGRNLLLSRFRNASTTRMRPSGAASTCRTARPSRFRAMPSWSSIRAGAATTRTC